MAIPLEHDYIYNVVMAQNTEANEQRMPRWLLRRWRIFKKHVLINEEFLEELPELSEEYKGFDNLPLSERLIGLARRFRIPAECVPALWALLENPDLLYDEQKLASLIKPPVGYVSYQAKVRGVEDDPNKAFEYWEQKRQQARAKGRDFEAEFDGIFLEVASYTTKDELLDFINEHYESHLEPLLRAGEGYFTPKELRSGRIREPKKRNELIIGWHKDGKTAREIEALLDFELDVSSIRRIIRNAK